MKLNFPAIIIATTLLFSSSACKKSESTTTPAKKSSLSYTVNGTTFVQCDVFSLGVVGGATDNTSVSASVSSSAANAVSMAIEKDVVGTFALYSMYIIYNGQEYERSVSESIRNVTTNNTEKIQGTFTGKFYKTTPPYTDFITITNGKFEVFR